MSRVFHRWLVFSLLAVLSGCVVAVAPLHRHPTEQNATILTVREDGGTVTPPPQKPTVVIKEPHGCPNYLPPAHVPSPKPPVFTKADRKNPDLLNVKLVKYMKELHDYNERVQRENTAAYKAYRAACLKQGAGIAH